MNIEELKRHWDQFGRAKPIEILLGDETWKTNYRDESKIEEVFLHGEKQIDQIMRTVRAHGVNLGVAKALDFGCVWVGLLSPCANTSKKYAVLI